MITLFTTATFLVLGVSVWVLIKEILTVHVPPPIPQRVKFHMLHYFFQLTIALVSFLVFGFGFCFYDSVLSGIERIPALGKSWQRSIYIWFFETGFLCVALAVLELTL
jgi:hypothetical protein